MYVTMYTVYVLISHITHLGFLKTQFYQTGSSMELMLKELMAINLNDI